jgi:CDP-diacylglycerol--serine O-phosphatidyltransferase
MNHSDINLNKKQKLLRRVRRQRLRYIAILPSLITLINGVCGFAAIVFASRGFADSTIYDIKTSNFAWAGSMIIVAMIADMLDGRIARMSQTTSSFGGQLDSLCDMVSFGVAPAFLMLKVTSLKLVPFVDPATPAHEGFLSRFIWLAAAIYVACAAIRLARFNVENEEDGSNHMSFIGLPTPAGAGVLASLVLFYQNVTPKWGVETSLYAVTETIIIYALPFVTIGIAVLMISRVPYTHAVNRYLKGRKPVAYLFWALGIFGFIGLCGLTTALFIGFCVFVISGFAKWCYSRIAKKGFNRQMSEPAILSVTNQKDAERGEQ